MTDSSWPKGTGTQAASPPAYPAWERPDPPRLNDTSALVRKGVHPYELMLRGNKWTSPLETSWNPEHTFNGSNHRGLPDLAVSPSYGAGAVIAMREPHRSRNGRTADGNGSVPRSGSLAVAVSVCKNC